MGLLQGMDVVARELALFAGVGLLIGGLDDLLVDFAYFVVRALRPRRRLTVAGLPSAPPRRFALLVPAWREEEVIGAMLAAALARLRGADYRIFVGCYPNDPATIAAVRAVRDPRIECSWTGNREGGVAGIDRDEAGLGGLKAAEISHSAAMQPA